MPFAYSRATSVDNAVELLGASGALPLGGGTDLLVAIRERVLEPSVLVDLRGIPGGNELTLGTDGGLRLGGAAQIAAIGRDEYVRRDYPALSTACESVGTTALRNMGTLGGNLCQRPRCWYFRQAIPCWKNGGTACPAAVGENQYHAILGGGPCHIVHPSDPAVALAALDAAVQIAGPSGTRTAPMGEFYVLPEQRLDHETTLQAGEFVAAVDIPPASAGGQQCYLKLMQRGAWDFALASIAAVRRKDGNVRMVLGGVAPIPWRVDHSVEEDVASGGLSDDDRATLAERALYDARPLAKNGYKVELAKTLLIRAMEFLSRGQST
jgi:xanthine dehydrogenase YagS FAD-binding subunit